ncbi:MAG: carbohydrate kinase [Bacteroidales bacterium]|nr:carbohydrate kinase [Bacteroidales bacterium]MBN2698938.1 carbohydrate kinase [Bacteroidales bacterium]
MSVIYAVGETILDIIFKDDIPRSGKPGGSSFNSAVSMGRLGLPVTFISELGNDPVGDMIIRFLIENHVESRYVSRFKKGQTAIALAFLDDNNDAVYQFYKDYPYQRLNIEFPDFSQSDYLLFGSFYALNYGIRPRIKLLLEKAVSSGSCVLYDPNFRDNHMRERDQLLEVIGENMEYADLVRGSDEDFRNIFGVSHPDEAWDAVRKHCGIMVYTANAQGVYLKTDSLSLFVEVEQIRPVSTIGAGDTFNAGLLYGLFKRGVRSADISSLDVRVWKAILKTASEFSREVCLSYENYLPVDFVKRCRGVEPTE